jgi:hypothetical protein
MEFHRIDKAEGSMFQRLIRRRRDLNVAVCWNDGATDGVNDDSHAIDLNEPGAEDRVEEFVHSIRIAFRIEDGAPKCYVSPESDSGEDYWAALAIARAFCEGFPVKICVAEPPPATALPATIRTDFSEIFRLRMLATE